MSLLSRTYQVDYGAKSPTRYTSPGPPPAPGAAIVTPIGPMKVVEVTKRPGLGRTGVLAARRVL